MQSASVRMQGIRTRHKKYGCRGEANDILKKENVVNIIGIAKRVLLLGCAALLGSSSMLVAQAGSLDPTFGDAGIVTTPNTTTGCGQPVNCAMAIQSNGKIVVAGGASASNNAPEIALARYNTNGTL